MQLINRTLSILSALAESPSGQTLAELSNRIGLPPSTTHRIVAVLEKERFVTRSPTNRRYFVGPAASRLGDEVVTLQSPLVTAHAAVEKAQAASGETVFLCGMTGEHVVCLAMCQAPRALRLFVWTGQTMPLHAAASARALIAWRSPEQVERLLGPGPYRGFTHETPRTIAEVLERLRLVQKRGYDMCESELDEDVWAVSWPIRSSTDAVISTVTLAAPQTRVADPRIREEFTEIVRVAALEMSTDLGWVSAEGESTSVSRKRNTRGG